MSNQKGKQNQVFGYQLLLDLYGCKEGTCDDLSLCYQFLDDIVVFGGVRNENMLIHRIASFYIKVSQARTIYLYSLAIFSALW